MKSNGVVPSLEKDLTEVTNVFEMSNNASASATCSLGLSTETHKSIEALKGKVVIDG